MSTPWKREGGEREERDSLTPSPARSLSLSPSFPPFFSDKQSLLILPPSSEAVLVYMASRSSGFFPPAFTQPELKRSGALLSSEALALTLVACSSVLLGFFGKKKPRKKSGYRIDLRMSLNSFPLYVFVCRVDLCMSLNPFPLYAFVCRVDLCMS